MSGHTPGPWTSKGSTIYGDNRCIGTAYTRKGFEPAEIDEAKANARLIAAAPDLLRELQKGLACIVSPESFNCDGVERDLRAAITKAEGES